jgi:hypothetical protein
VLRVRGRVPASRINGAPGRCQPHRDRERRDRDALVARLRTGHLASLGKYRACRESWIGGPRWGRGMLDPGVVH